jgi:septum formation protein
MTTGRPLLYLASHSPRRRELLRQINVRFETLLLRSDRMRGSDVEEIVRAGEAPTDYVTRITLEKARMGAARARERGMAPGVVLAADTEVVIDGEALGKPRDAAAATQMLTRLSGRSPASSGSTTAGGPALAAAREALS